MLVRILVRVTSSDGSQPSLPTYFFYLPAFLQQKSVSTNKVVVAVDFVLVVVAIVITALQYVSTTSTSFAAACCSEDASEGDEQSLSSDGSQPSVAYVSRWRKCASSSFGCPSLRCSVVLL